MLSKGYVKAIPGIMVIMLVISGLVLFGMEVQGTAPEVNSITYDPLEPTVDDEFNFTVVYDVYDEPINEAKIQVCIDGICYMMEDMIGDGTGYTYWKEYLPSSFPAGKIVEFHLYIEYGQGLKMVHGENITFTAVPHDIFLNGTLSMNTLKPNQTVNVDGNLTYDIGDVVKGAQINLSIGSLGIFNTTYTDSEGNFSLDLLIPQKGEHTLSLDAVKGELTDHMEWAITVSPWSLPNIGIKYDSIDFDELDSPPGASTSTFYTDSNVTLSFNIENTGNDEARNISTTVTIDNASQMDMIDAGNLLPGERYPGTYLLNTSLEGRFKLNITADWEQTAPFPEGFNPPAFEFDYNVVPRPQWTGHTVFIEMFTQITCGPCVYIEESLEILHEEGIDFEFVVYVTEDTESGIIAEGLNISATPVLFIDEDLFRKDGSSEDLEAEMDEIRGLIEDAASLERPPVSLEFEDEDVLSLNSYLDPEFRDTVSGIIEIYSVEVHSNLRNYQGIPMSNRYLTSATGQEMNELQPGNWFNFTVDRPAEGEGLVAVLKDDEGTVIQSVSLINVEHPKAYLETDQVLITAAFPGDHTFSFTIDRFQTGDMEFEDVDIHVIESGLAAGWNITYNEGTLSSPGVMMTFSYSGSQKVTKPVGRTRYSQDYEVTITVPENISGPFNFDLIVEIDNITYTLLVVVVVPEPGAPEIEITDSYLVGEGKTIYFYVEATGVPEGAHVKGRILPCNYGPNAACGLPEDFLLIDIGDGVYRASVIGIDLTTYTHLTHSSWVEFEGVRYSQTEEVQVEISSLVTIESDDDGGGDGISPWVFIFSVTALFIIMGLAVIIFVIARRSPGEESIEEIEGEPYRDEAPSEEGSDEVMEEGDLEASEISQGSEVGGEIQDKEAVENDVEQPDQGSEGSVEDQVTQEHPEPQMKREYTKHEEQEHTVPIEEPSE